MTPDDNAGRRPVDAAFLDARRPMLIKFAVLCAVFVVGGLFMAWWDWRDSGAAASLMLSGLALYLITLNGALAVGRHRQRVIRAGHGGELRPAGTPVWVSGLLAVLPGITLVAAQAIGRTSHYANDFLLVFAAYLFTIGLGLTFGLLLPLSPGRLGNEQ